MKAKRGLKFHHSKWQNMDGKPQLFVVTRVVQGVVYYRPVYEDGKRGAPYTCNVEEFGKHVLQTAPEVARP